MESIKADFYGNHRPGLKQNFENHCHEIDKFMSNWEQREEDKKLYDDRAEKRQKFVMALITLLLLLVTTIFGIMAYERTSHSRINLGDTQVYDADSNIK